MNEPITYIEMFCGIGGFRLGLERAGASAGAQRKSQGDAKEGAQTGFRHESVELRCRGDPRGADHQLVDGGGEGQPPRRTQELEKANNSFGEHSKSEKGGVARRRDLQHTRNNTSTEGKSWKASSKDCKFRCVWANDNDKYACQVYRKNFGDKELVEADITAVDAGSIPDHDLLTAGFPCQAFSVAGKRLGFEDTRGTLFFEIVRVLKAKRPRHFLLENVKGLLSHQNGETFQTIVRILAETGYIVEWSVLNSKNFGVPQNRERVFLIGHLARQRTREVFPIGETYEDATGTCETPSGTGSRLRVANTLSRRYYKDGSENLIADFNQDGNVYVKNESATLRSPKASQSNLLIHNIYGGFKEKKPRVFKDYSPTIRTPKGGGHLPMVVQPCLTPDRAKKRQHGRRFKGDGEPMFTLTGQDVHGVSLLTLDAIGNNDSNANASKAYTNEILRMVWKEIGEGEGERRRLNEFAAFLQEEILQQIVHGKRFQGKMEEKSPSTTRKLQGKAVDTSLQMFNLWKNIKFGHSPQKRRQIEQLLGKLASIMSELPQQGAQATKEMQNMWRHSERSRPLQQTPHTNEEAWQSPLLSGKVRIRRLTPKEAERLQGFPDDFTKYGVDAKGGQVPISDTQRYKLLGNAVTTNVVEFLGRRLLEAMGG